MTATSRAGSTQVSNNTYYRQACHCSRPRLRQHAMPVLRLVSRRTMAIHCSDKREIWHGERYVAASPCQISRLSGQKCGNATHKTVKI